MGYFTDAKIGDKVYGLIFGKGKIINNSSLNPYLKLDWSKTKTNEKNDY